jgi:hypothetical protein
MTALPVSIPGPLDPRLALAPGGFTWWYVDMVDEAGDGLVAIVALGLPFLPGYTSAGRAGRAELAARRPSVCVAAVRGGRPSFWALHEVDPAEVAWEPERVRLGASRLEMESDGERVHLWAHLEGVLPGCPWSLDLELEGAKRKPAPREPATTTHAWSVLTAATEGRATLSAPQPWQLQGRAYVDRNGADRSLDELGVVSWHWGRLALPDHELVWYSATDVEGQVRSTSLRIEPDGTTTESQDQVTTEGARRGLWGLSWPARVHPVPGLPVDLGRPIDDSPFYARFLVQAPGAAGFRGFAEACRVDRIDQGWFRPLLRMTVCPPSGPGSLWLPLFAGPRERRLLRLLRWTS